ncbi:hypothetical protein BH09SUM1_BH09SUM1_13880 [soil metagenome]
MDPTVKEESSRPRFIPVEPGFTLDSLIGKAIDDRYQVDELIGQGAMGAVFRARQLRLRRDVAIKVPKPEFCNDPEFLARFEREALTMAKLVHENVVQVFDVYVSKNPNVPSFIAMEIVEGAELEKFLRLQENSLTVAAVVDIFMQVARGLDTAHQHGIVHRDIKPSNIIVTMPQRVAKIMDFGIARIDMDGVFATQEAAAIGTPAFMAPEQVRGEAIITPAADIYAFAMTIYRLLARKIAFEATSATSLLFKQVNEAPIPLHERNPRVPPEVHKVLLKALNKDPEKRPISVVEFVGEVAEALKPLENVAFSELFPSSSSSTNDTVVEQTPSHPSHASTVMRAIARKKNTIIFAASVGAIAVLGGVVGAALMMGRSKPAVSVAEQPEPSSVVRAAQTDPALPVLPTPTSAAAPLTIGSATASPAPSPAPIVDATPTTARRNNAGIPSRGGRSEFDKAEFNPTVNVPLNTAEARPVRILVQDYVSSQVEKPFNRSQFDLPANALVRLMNDGARDAASPADTQSAGELIDGFRQLQPKYDELALAIRIRNDSVFWDDRALLRLDVAIKGRPKGVTDGGYRHTAFETTTPVSATVRLENGKCRVTAFRGDESEFRMVSTKDR